MDKTTLENLRNAPECFAPTRELVFAMLDTISALTERAERAEAAVERMRASVERTREAYRIANTAVERERKLIDLYAERAERAEQERDEALARLITESELADMMQIPFKTLRKWRCYGGGPKFVKFGDAKRSLVRYRVQDVTAFVDGCAVLSSADVHNRSRNKERNGGG